MALKCYPGPIFYRELLTQKITNFETLYKVWKVALKQLQSFSPNFKLCKIQTKSGCTIFCKENTTSPWPFCHYHLYCYSFLGNAFLFFLFLKEFLTLFTILKHLKCLIFLLFIGYLFSRWRTHSIMSSFDTCVHRISLGDLLNYTLQLRLRLYNFKKIREYFHTLTALVMAKACVTVASPMFKYTTHI